jgi:hypothetical protein
LQVLEFVNGIVISNQISGGGCGDLGSSSEIAHNKQFIELFNEHAFDTW